MTFTIRQYSKTQELWYRGVKYKGSVVSALLERGLELRMVREFVNECKRTRRSVSPSRGDVEGLGTRGILDKDQKELKDKPV